MRSTAIDRRTLLGALAGAPLLSLVSLRAYGASAGTQLFVSARADADGHFVTGLDEDGRVVFDLPLPERGHSSVFHPSRAEAVHFARRPGTFARVIDIRGGRYLASIEAQAGRHFYGHGAFSPDGAVLYATENDFENGTGVIGMYAVEEGYRRVGELPSHGIGPHDLRLLSDGRTMAIANGGILTRPDLPRMKLNIPTMQPSLVYMDSRDGTLLEEVKLPSQLHRLSIRHMDVAEDDLVAIVMQDEGPRGVLSPLVGTHRRGSEIDLFPADDETLQGMRQYCGSVAFDASRRVLAVSSPRGSLVTFWEAASGRFLDSLSVSDGCGIAPRPGGGRFLASSGEGGVLEIALSGGSSSLAGDDRLARSQWDNHLVTAL